MQIGAMLSACFRALHASLHYLNRVPDGLQENDSASEP